METDEILKEINAADMYNKYFKIPDGGDYSLIFTDYYEIAKKIRGRVKQDEFNTKLLRKLYGTCDEKIGEGYIKYLMNKVAVQRDKYIILVPCNNDCENMNDFRGFIIAEKNYNNEEDTLFIHLICSNGSYLIALLILIANKLNIKKMYLDSLVPDENGNPLLFYLKRGFLEDNRILEDKKLIPMTLDMEIYNDENLDLISRRKMPNLPKRSIKLMNMLEKKIEENREIEEKERIREAEEYENQQQNMLQKQRMRMKLRREKMERSRNRDL